MSSVRLLPLLVLSALGVLGSGSDFAAAQATSEAPATDAVAAEAPSSAAPTPVGESPESPTLPSHAPRMSSLTLGYDWSPDDRLPLSPTGGSYRPMGFAVEGRYGWKVGGLDGSRPTFVGFSLSFLAHTRGAPRDAFGLDYGVFARHTLGADRTVRPFLAYGLGAAQLFVTGVDGRGIGHLTMLSLGIDARLAESRHLTVELAYRVIILPTFETAVDKAHRYDLQTVRLVAGMRFGR